MAETSQLPLFYKNPVLLRFDEHKGAGLQQREDFSFARETIGVPLCIGEFAAAQRFYPIVFTADDHHTPLAVMGVKEGENLLVDDKGKWKAGYYVPAYVRRYPFIITDTSKKTQLLAIDGAADRFLANASKTKTALPLFDATGEPTAIVKSATALCQAFQAEHLKTVAFVKALVEAGLLTQNHAQMQFADGNRYRLDGFMVVDDQTYHALPATTLADWLGQGWLDAIALQRASQQNWKALLDLHVKRGGSQKAAA